MQSDMVMIGFQISKKRPWRANILIGKVTDKLSQQSYKTFCTFVIYKDWALGIAFRKQGAERKYYLLIGFDRIILFLFNPNLNFLVYL